MNEQDMYVLQKKKKKNEQDIISTSFSPPLLFSFVPTSKPNFYLPSVAIIQEK